MDLLNDYTEDQIKDMINVYERHLKTRQYRRNYYKNKYNNDVEFREKKKLENKIHIRNKRKNENLSV